MTLAVPIIIYIAALISLLLALSLGAVVDIQKSNKPLFKSPSWGEIVTALLSFVFVIVACIGFPAGTITLFIWAVLALS